MLSALRSSSPSGRRVLNRVQRMDHRAPILAASRVPKLVPVTFHLANSNSMSSEASAPLKEVERRPIRRIMAANRGEIALRIFRACHELEISTVGIFSKEDAGQMHRLKADMSFPLDTTKGPIEAYLDVNNIVNIAKVCKTLEFTILFLTYLLNLLEKQSGCHSSWVRLLV